jgi:hypothetical protein
MASAKISELWYYVLDNQSQGPASVEEMHKLIEQNKILPTTMVCNVGGSVWYAAKEWNVLWKTAKKPQATETSDTPKRLPASANHDTSAWTESIRLPVAEPQVAEVVVQNPYRSIAIETITPTIEIHPHIAKWVGR